MTRDRKDPSPLVSVTELARLLGCGRGTAREMLRRWWAEQQAGGEVRVVYMGTDKQGRPMLATTRAVLHSLVPMIRDEALVRRVEQLERDYEASLRKMLGRIENLERIVHALDPLRRIKPAS